MNKTIYDYLDYYKDYTFDEVLFNQMDALVFSIIIYLPLETKKEVISLEHMDYYFVMNSHGAMVPVAKEIYKIISTSRRYKDLKVSNIVKTNNTILQFGAMTIRDNKNTYVVYEGTNASASGWMENFMLSCKYPTTTQEWAVKYLNSTIKITDKRIYLCGHSKGGNLAMASAMMCKNIIFNKIDKIYNFDGPGFRDKEYNSIKFKEVNKKTTTILPEGSLVGTILFNNNYTYVASKSIGFKQHYPTNWIVFGQFFVESNLNIASKKYKENLDKSLVKLKPDDMLKILKEVDIFFKNNEIYEHGFSDMNYNDFKRIVLEINGVDENTKKIFVDVVKLMLSPDKNK